MKFLMIKIIAAILLSVGFAAAQKISSAAPKTVRAKIYLLDNFESEDLLKNVDMFAVERSVSADFPLRAALEEQLRGATEEENTQLLFSPVTGIKLISVKVKNKTAYADFARTSSGVFDALAARRFRLAVAKTARQFSSVRRIEICLDGILNFGTPGKSSPKPCRR